MQRIRVRMESNKMRVFRKYEKDFECVCITLMNKRSSLCTKKYTFTNIYLQTKSALE